MIRLLHELKAGFEMLFRGVIKALKRINRFRLWLWETPFFYELRGRSFQLKERVRGYPALHREFYKRTGYPLSLSAPATFHHKLTWLKIQRPPKLFVPAVDKSTAKELAGFNPSDLLGKECLLTVGHYDKPNGDTGVAVTAVSSVPEGMTVDKTETEVWEYDPEKPTVNFDRLLDWQQERVRQSHEYRNAMKGKHDSSGLDETDNAPF